MYPPPHLVVKPRHFRWPVYLPVQTPENPKFQVSWTIFGVYIESGISSGSGAGTERYPGNKPKFETALKLAQK